MTTPFTSLAERSSTASSNNSSTTTTPSSNNLTRSKRSTFAGKEGAEPEKIRILYEYERLVHYSKSPHARAMPADWTKICLKAPNVVRSKVNEEGAKVLQSVYSWLEEGAVDNNNNNTLHAATTNPSVKFQRNLSFDEQHAAKSSSLGWARKSFDQKRRPLVHSKSTCD